MKMKQALPTEVQEVLDAVLYKPAVSIIMPFETRMSLKSELSYALKLAVQKVERELKKNYATEISDLIIDKLDAMIRNLNYNTIKKSIAIYVSPVFEKVIYLDIPVEEKIIVDESFEIRDLVLSKKELHKYLVLLLSQQESRMYLGNTDSFIRIQTSTPASIDGFVNELPERVSNFSDPSSMKEIMLDKFLHQVDQALQLILNTYHLPLFVVGTDRLLGHFKSISRHDKSVIEYIHGNYIDLEPNELIQLLKPHVEDWKKVKQIEIRKRLEDAAGKNVLVSGMKEVWKAAIQHKGKLLIVEKNYRFAAESKDITEKPHRRFSHVKDAIDDLIEKVLEGGGDIEFVDPEVIKDHNHIALIKYY